MSILTLVGLQWGDEGKGKVADLLSLQADVAVRFQGGSNAGHSIEYQNKKFVLHQVPSGIFNPKCEAILGNGMVIDLLELKNEIEGLEQKKIKCKKRIFISDGAHLILPIYKILDKISEFHLGKASIGTTHKGIGPAYSAKINRRGFRVGDLSNSASFKKLFFERMEEIYKTIKADCKKLKIKPETIETSYNNLMRAYKYLKPMFCDSLVLVNNKKKEKKKILLEGAQGSLLDLDHGTYPFVTSSNTLSAMAALGSGLSPRDLKNILGIFKAYTTRVGSGPFPTELTDNAGKYLQEQGREFGSTTGRNRRCGWLDLCLLRKTILLNGVTHLGIMKLDILDELAEIKVCVSYKTSTGKKLLMPPTKAEDWYNLKPQFKKFTGWKSKTSSVKTIAKLPANCKKYLSFLQNELELPIVLVSASPKREDCIVTKKFFKS